MRTEVKDVSEYDEADQPVEPAETGAAEERATAAPEVARREAAEAAAEEGSESTPDPVEQLRESLRFAPGEWFVVHSYAGYENKVKSNLENRIISMDMEDYIYQVEVPTRQEVEVKNGKRMQVQNKIFPGYILVRMELTPESYSCVRVRRCHRPR